MKTAVLIVLLAGAWAALMPPFFTHGACTAEFDAASGLLEGARAELATLSQAQVWLGQHTLQYQVVSAASCESSAPLEVQICPGGPVLLITVPVKNPVCRYYRDSTIRQQLAYNSLQQLVRIQTDMRPYRTLSFPGVAFQAYFAR